MKVVNLDFLNQYISRPWCEGRLRGGGAHGDVVFVHAVVFGADAPQGEHAFIDLTETARAETTTRGREAHLYALFPTYEIAAEALAELKHAGSLRQGARDVERLGAWRRGKKTERGEATDESDIETLTFKERVLKSVLRNGGPRPKEGRS